MIGPWDSYGREDFSIVHPPEISVDFDAVYTDGQVGTGIMETDSDPIKVDWRRGAFGWNIALEIYAK